MPPEFPSTVARLMDGAITVYRPLTMHFLRIEGWFGSEWLGFKGKVLSALGVTAMDSSNYVIPPFHPNRVIAQSQWTRSSTSAPWSAVADSKPLHIVQHSESNMTRRLDRIVPPRSVLAWFGESGHDWSLMVYALPETGPLGWYVAESGGRSQLLGIARQEIALLQDAASQ